MTAGQAIIGTPFTNQLLIDQSSTNAIINWQGFSIGAGNSVQFNNGTGATLNRVTGSAISQINGSLSATGSLFVINSNGIVVGQNGIVNTGGSFVASTLDIADSDFLNGGSNTFAGTSTASVVNYGRISSLGGDVALIARTVTNEGEINAPNGTAGLLAGQEILMRDAAVSDGLFEVRIGGPETSASNSGRINAAAAELRANGGNVYALAGNTGGSVQATGATIRGSRVFLTAPGGRVVTSSRVRARRVLASRPSVQGGGSVFINADFVSIGGIIDVDGYEGGTVMIDAGLMSLAEPIHARGQGGNGGRVEITSAGDSLVFSTGMVDVSGAVNGGSIRHTTGRTLTHSGQYLATGLSGLGGTIDLGGGALKLLSPTIDASGYLGGGSIRIGGEYQGGKGLLIDELPNSLRLAVTDATAIYADATGADGDGGTVILWGDERAAVFGSVSARPGTNSGNGGFVEVSSAGELIYRADVSTGLNGRNGTVLLDPKVFTVDNVANFDQSIFILGSEYNFPNMATDLDPIDGFGSAVSLDGTRLAVGAHEDESSNNGTFRAGAVYLFSFTDSVFNGGVLEAILGKGYVGGKNIDVAALESNDGFGRAVSLDGNRLAVSAPVENGAGNATSQSGAVYLFSFTDSTFSGGSLEATVGRGYAASKDIDVTALGISDQFGMGVSLDGNRLAIGARRDDAAANNTFDTGAVYLFSFSDSTFSGGALEAIVGSGYAGPKDINVAGLDNLDLFGTSVSLNGNRLAVGAVYDDGLGNAVNNSGAVYLFSFADSAFNGGALEAVIGRGYIGGKNVDVAVLEAGDGFGLGVSLDGNRLAVGAVNDNGAGNIATDSGAVYLFSFADAVFSGGTLEATIGRGYTGGKNIDVASLENSDEFGASVSLNGNRLAVGARFDDGAGNVSTDSGAVYLFTNIFGSTGAGDPVTDAVFATRVGDNITITPAALKALLDAGNNVILQANTDGFVKAPIVVSNLGGNGGNLTLQVGRSLLIEASIVTDGGNLTLIANEILANGVVDGDRDPGNGVITINAGVELNLGAGVFLLDLRNGAGKTNFGAGDVTFGAGSLVTAGRIQILNNGVEAANQVIFNAGTVLTASGSGDAVVISADVFNNNADAGLFNFTGGGRFLIYSNTFTGGNFNAGGLAGGNLYNRNLAANPAGSIGQAGNQFLFNFQPVLLVTANNATRQYGLANPAFGAAITGLVNGDALGGAVAGNAALASVAGLGTNVGGVPIIASLGSLLSDIGYAFAFAPGTQTITQAALTITADDLTRVEGTANPEFTANFAGFRNGDNAGVFTAALAFNTTAGAGSAPGNFAIVPTGATAQNYAITFVPGTILVTAAAAGGNTGSGISGAGGDGNITDSIDTDGSNSDGSNDNDDTTGSADAGGSDDGGNAGATTTQITNANANANGPVETGQGLGGNSGSGFGFSGGGANGAGNTGSGISGAGGDGNITNSIDTDGSNSDGSNDNDDTTGSADAGGGDDGGASGNAPEENVEEAEVTDPDYPDFAVICRENIGEIAGFCQLY